MNRSEQFKQIKELLEANNFELVTENDQDNEKYFVVKVKDEWEGVEFAECIWSGKIFPISQINYKPDKSEFGISTEQAYIDQLKAKAFELYGEIKEGDRFDCSEMGYSKNASILLSKCLGLYYSKKFDSLELCGFTLYKQGKWAKKIVKDNITNASCCIDKGKFTFTCDIEGRDSLKGGEYKFLTQKLEGYLNE